MKVREKLMRKVMAVVIAAATIFSISGGTKVVPVKAAVEVAEVLDLNERSKGSIWNTARGICCGSKWRYNTVVK